MTTAKKYRVLVGMNYPDPSSEDGAEKRAEIGDVIDDLPAEAIKGLLKAEAIEHVKPGPKPSDEPELPEPEQVEEVVEDGVSR